MAVKMTVEKNLVAVKGLLVAVNFGEGGSEGLSRSGDTDASTNTSYITICELNPRIWIHNSPKSQIWIRQKKSTGGS